MKIAILSRNPALYSTQSLVRAGRKKGHYMVVIDHMRCDLFLEKNKPQIYYENDRLKGIAGIIPRIGSSVTGYGLSVIQQFEAMGIFTTLSSEALMKSRNKFRSMQILTSAGLNIPKTILSNNPYTTTELLEMLGKPPYILKLATSTHGMGVIKSDDIQNAETIVDAFYRNKNRVLMQEYIGEANGADLRVFIVDGEIVGSMKRQAREGEFRSNLHRGAYAEPISLTEQERSTALKAAQLMGLKIAGVDMLQSKRGPLVLEVNASPGLEGIERTTGVDIANSIISFVERKLKRRHRF